MTGHPDSILAHDLKYYGLNIPAEYCEPWPVEAAPVAPDEVEVLMRDWQYEVSNGDTLLGFEDWQAHKQESEE